MATSITVGNYQVLDSGSFQVFDNNDIELTHSSDKGKISILVKFFDEGKDKETQLKKVIADNVVIFEAYNISKTIGGIPFPIEIATLNDLRLYILFSIIPLTTNNGENSSCFVFNYTFLQK